MSNRVLFVCTGNLCRSPMAAALLRHRLGDAVVADSVGLLAPEGSPIDPRAETALAARGISAGPHAARRPTLADIEHADFVLAMEKRQIAALCALMPRARGRTFLLGKWHDDTEIPDPYGRDADAFDECCRLIDDAVGRWSAYLITPASRRADVHEHARRT
jgi:protein-tyrosine phosphatase